MTLIPITMKWLIDKVEFTVGDIIKPKDSTETRDGHKDQKVTAVTVTFTEHRWHVLYHTDRDNIFDSHQIEKAIHDCPTCGLPHEACKS